LIISSVDRIQLIAKENYCVKTWHCETVVENKCTANQKKGLTLQTSFSVEIHRKYERFKFRKYSCVFTFSLDATKNRSFYIFKLCSKQQRNTRMFQQFFYFFRETPKSETVLSQKLDTKPVPVNVFILRLFILTSSVCSCPNSFSLPLLSLVHQPAGCAGLLSRQPAGPPLLLCSAVPLGVLGVGHICTQCVAEKKCKKCVFVLERRPHTLSISFSKKA
jgi:hypothetical protein